ncbi:hypothetical protein SFC66_12460 [Terribacillus saccharophilus]|uniref:hypothetical protein n=1 Tax=Terribacillus saccharophilus TaxID=361277 RepID=UPI003982D587
MKQRIVVFTCIFLISLLTIGCNSTDKKETNADAKETSTIVEDAINQGKLALADGDVSKATSNFKLAAAEDLNNKEAANWLKLVGHYNEFITLVDDRDIKKATKTLEYIKSDVNYSIIEEITKEYEETLEEDIAAVEEIDNKIAELEKLYDPSDKNSMPDETYLVRAEEILEDPYITEEQKKTVNTFKDNATDRVDSIHARKKKYKLLA